MVENNPTWKYQNLDVSSASRENYQISLKKENNGWKIQSLYSADVQFYVSHYGETEIDIDAIRNNFEILEQSFAEIGKAERQEMMNLGTSLSRYTIFINTTDLVSYARTYALNYNSNFPVYGGDCQNFASQCVWKGGGGVNNQTAIDNHYSPMTTTWWCTSTGSCSPSWNSVTGFRDALHDNYINGTLGPKGIRWSGVFAAEPGDLIQVRWSAQASGNTQGYHVFVVTAVTGLSGYRTTSDITVCAHTKDKKDALLSACIGSDQLRELNTLHVTGINN